MNKHIFVVLVLLSVLLITGCMKDELSRTPPSNLNVTEVAENYSFAVIGDYGSEGKAAQQVSDMIKSWNPAFIITAGDNNYNDGKLETIHENIGQYYCDFIYNPDAPEGLRCNGAAAKEKKNRFFPSLGNHDHDNKNGSIPYLNYFTLPGNEEYYHFTWGPVHFFTIDSDKKDEELEVQKQWLEAQLQQSKAPFKLVYFHHSPYSEGKHGNAERMQWDFEAWGVSAVITGHDHIYQRIHHKAAPSLLYFVNGLGGKSVRDCGKEPLDPDEFEVYCYDGDYGAMKVTVDPQSLHFAFYSIGDWETPVDEFRLK